MVQIHAVPAFRDNYIWVLDDGRHAVAVDPGDDAPVREFLGRTGLTLSAVLATHHHADHVGGLVALAREWRCPTFGPAREDVAGLDRRLTEGDHIVVPGLELALSVLDIPGHTAGHIAFAGDDLVFCGDTLFACGCGRLFEGTPAMMVRSLSRLRDLPDDTLVWCGHEYTLGCLRFAVTIEPDNTALRDRLARVAAAPGQPTVPLSLAEERATNPFLRWDTPAVRAWAGSDDDVATFAKVREAKNEWKG